MQTDIVFLMLVTCVLTALVEFLGSLAKDSSYISSSVYWRSSDAYTEQTSPVTISIIGIVKL